MTIPTRDKAVFDDITSGSRVLLLNPPIADTAEAEDMDMITCVEPFGLLRIGSYFRSRGAEVSLLDALRDPSLEGMLRGHVRKELPCGDDGTDTIKKVYHFGLDKDALATRLRDLPTPDVVAVTSIFTWHVDALGEALEVVKEVLPSTRVVLGGNFPTVCPDEASATAADIVFQGDIQGAEFLPTAIDLLPYGTDVDYLRMIKGCPYKCNYCITNVLNDGRVMVRSPDEVYEELLEKRRSNGTRTFVLYDDFILFKQAKYLDPLLDRVIREKLDVNLEFPLGFSAHMVTDEFASRMSRAGVEQLTIALETISPARSEDMGRPHHIDEFLRAVGILKSHGYRGRRQRIFYLMGLPGQTLDEILTGILFLYHHQLIPCLTTYTITPGSGDMALYGDSISFSGLDELSPGLWRFANPDMRVADLDRVYRYFHEQYYPIERIMRSVTDDPIITRMQALVAEGRHLPENW